jgi:hypothetical protein
VEVEVGLVSRHLVSAVARADRNSFRNPIVFSSAVAIASAISFRIFSSDRATGNSTDGRHSSLIAGYAIPTLLRISWTLTKSDLSNHARIRESISFGRKTASPVVQTAPF